MSHFFYVGGGDQRSLSHFLFYAYNSSRNAKKISGRGGVNPLNCHTKWGGDQKKKCDKCHTFFFFPTLTGSLNFLFRFLSQIIARKIFFFQVCGSNKKTYRNICQLNRDNCESGDIISELHRGLCR